MLRSASLGVRLSVAVASVQLLSVIVALALFPLLGPFTSYGLVADRTARSAVALSIGPAHAIEDRGRLREYRSSRPTLRYAAADSRGVLGGSDPALARLLARVAPQMLQPGSSMELAEGRGREAVFVTTVASGAGPIIFATTGNRFGWSDVPSYWLAFLPAVLPGYGPVLLAGLIVLPVVLAGLLRPLRRVAQKVGGFDIEGADTLLPVQGLPVELRPLCEEIDAALARLRGGFARQRLFFANAAHELRTPVAILQAQLQQSVPGSTADVALTQVRRLGVLVDQLLSVARLEHAQAEPVRLDLRSLARTAALDCAPVALGKGVLIACEMPDVPIWISGDRGSLHGAVTALIDNAVRVEPRGGEVLVQLDRDGVLSIVDHGPGFSQAERERAFEPFWRRDDDGSGFGLGLAAVRRTAEMHGGSALIADGETGGARLVIRIPTLSAADRDAPRPSNVQRQAEVAAPPATGWTAVRS